MGLLCGPLCKWSCWNRKHREQPAEVETSRVVQEDSVILKKPDSIPLPSIFLNESNAQDTPHRPTSANGQSPPPEHGALQVPASLQPAESHTSNKSKTLDPTLPLATPEGHLSGSEGGSIFESKAQDSIIHDNKTLDELAKEYTDAIKSLMRDPSKTRHKIRGLETFVNSKRLRDELTRDKVKAFFKLVPRPRTNFTSRLVDGEDYMNLIYEQFLCVFATLLLMGFKEWEKFYELFYDQRDKNMSFTRCDQQLPLDRDELDFLGGEAYIHAFHDFQQIFKHATIEESHDGLNAEVRVVKGRLPVLSKRTVAVGDRPVEQVTIDSFCVRRTRDGVRGLNETPEDYSLKSFVKDTDFRSERRIHLTFKEPKRGERERHKAERGLRHVVVSVTEFYTQDRSFRYILYPWGDLTLHDLFRGKFTDFGVQNPGPFHPSTVLEQLAGLTDALTYLHDEIRIRHFDIKPDNIIVYGVSQGSCGTWKLADFGLARQHSKDIHLVPPGTEIKESSSLPAPRHIGPFQPPEMRLEENVTSTVNHKSDMYSLGAVITVCFAFLLGGPAAVTEFRCARSTGYKDEDTGLFYYKEGSAYKLKPEINGWFYNRYPHEWSNSDEWQQMLLLLVNSLLIMDGEGRSDAAPTYRDLLRIKEQSMGYQQTWTYQAPQKACDQMLKNPCMISELSTTDAFSFEQPPIKLSFKQPLSLKIGFPSNTVKIRLSPKWVMSLAPKDVRVHPLKPLYNQRSLWSDEGNYNQIHVPVSAWKGEPVFKLSVTDDGDDVLYDTSSGAINGDYIAIAIILQPGSRKVGVFNVVSKEQRDHEIPVECREFLVSASGALVLIFDDRFEVKPGDGTSYNSPPRPGETIQKATFSTDGKYFSLWCKKNDSYFWRVHLCKDWRRSSNGSDSSNGSNGSNNSNNSRVIKSQKHYRYSDVLTDLSQPNSLLFTPCMTGPDLFAFERNGRFWYISCEVEGEEERLYALNTGEDGVIDLAFPFAHGVTFVLYKDADISQFQLRGFGRTGHLTAQEKHPFLTTLAVGQNFHCDDTATVSPTDITAVEFDSAQAKAFGGSHGILAVYSTGGLQLWICRHDS